MQPQATSTLDMIRASAQDLKSPDPRKRMRAEEIRRRYEAGLFNDLLVKDGAQPVPVKVPEKKIDLQAALSVQGEGGQSKPEDAAIVDDAGGDLKEGFGSLQESAQKRGDQFARGLSEMGDIKTFGKGGWSMVAAPLGALIDTGSTFLKTIGKLGMTQEQENKLKTGFEKAMEETVNTPWVGSGGETPADTIGRVQKIVETWKQSDPESFQAFTEAGGDAMTLLEGLTGGSRPVTKTLEATVDATKRMGGVTMAGAEKSGELIKDGLGMTGNAIKNLVPDTSGAGQSLIANVNRINPTDRIKFKQQHGVSSEEWLQERGIIGTREDTVKQLSDNFVALRQNVDEALDMIPGTYRDNRVTTVAEEASQFAKTVESPESRRITELADKARGTGLTVKEINELKRFYERNIKTGYMQDPTKTSESVMLATNRDSALREYLFEVADQNGFSNLRQINKEIQGSKFLADKISGKMEGQAQNNPMSITDWIVATPGVTTDPKFLIGFGLKKGLSTETVRAFAAKMLSGFPSVRDLPRADLDDIMSRAQEVLRRQEDLRIQTEQSAILADELQKAGFTMSEGPMGFLTENPIPITQQEQALIRAAKNREEQLQMVKYIIEQRNQGNAVGQGFVMQKVENTPLLNPKGSLPEDSLKVSRDGALDQIKTEMLELSSTGMVKNADGSYRRFTTFPRWVPSEYRDSDLFNRVLTHIEEGTTPRANAVREQELYGIVQKEKQRRAFDMAAEKNDWKNNDGSRMNIDDMPFSVVAALGSGVAGYYALSEDGSMVPLMALGAMVPTTRKLVVKELKDHVAYLRTIANNPNANTKQIRAAEKGVNEAMKEIAKLESE